MRGTMHETIFMAAKRAPFAFERDPATGSLTTAALAPGGTGSVVADQARYLGTNWFASAMTDIDREAALAHPDGIDVTYDKPSRLYLLRHDPATFDRFQYSFTADILWQALHSLWETWREPSFGAEVREGWEAYLAINADFASALAGAARDTTDPIFLIHDYQLLCVPSYLREAMGDVPILSFSHLPWPAADGWRVLPSVVRTTLLQRLLAADVVGFFAERWVWNILCCIEDNVPGAVVDHERREVQFEGRRTRFRAMPLGYSPASLEHRPPRLDPDVTSWAGDRRLVVHAGRTDPIKNAGRAITAFATAAERSEVVRAARLLVKMNPNRLYVDVNAQYLADAERRVEQTNERFGEELVRLVVDDDVSLTLGLLAHADLVVLNSILDGQNLTAFETSLLNERSCGLVLSEGCGASEALRDVATIVNPFDIDEQADAIAALLALDEEEAVRRFDARREVALRHPLPTWVDAQLAEIALVRS